MSDLEFSGAVVIDARASKDAEPLWPVCDGGSLGFCYTSRTGILLERPVKWFCENGVRPDQIFILVSDDKQKWFVGTKIDSYQLQQDNIIVVNDCKYEGVIKGIIQNQSNIDDAVILFVSVNPYFASERGFMAEVKKAIDKAKCYELALVGGATFDVDDMVRCGAIVCTRPLDIMDESDLSISEFLKGNQVDPNPSGRPQNWLGDGWITETIADNPKVLCYCGISACRAQRVAELLRSKASIENHLDLMAVLVKRLNEGGSAPICVQNGALVSVFKDWYTMRYVLGLSRETSTRNICLGPGVIRLTDCCNSLFYITEGIELRARGIEKSEVIATIRDGRVVVLVLKEPDTMPPTAFMQACIKEEESNGRDSKATVLKEDMGHYNSALLLGYPFSVYFYGVSNYGVSVNGPGGEDDRIIVTVAPLLRK